MLTAIQRNNKVKINAFEAERVNAPFNCPACNCEVILKKGLKKVHHFAHKPPVTCDYGKGETEIHRRGKKAIFDLLKERGGYSELEIEKFLASVIPDVFVRYKGLSVAVELQKSNIGLEHIIYKTEYYTNQNIHVLWLVPYNKKLQEERYSPKIWEKWLHTLYSDKVYYFLETGEIIPVHFDEYKLYKEEGYNQDREAVGGYSYPSKRYRTPIRGKKIKLSKDFKRAKRDKWEGSGLSIPEALILKDNSEKWW